MLQFLLPLVVNAVGKKVFKASVTYALDSAESKRKVEEARKAAEIADLVAKYNARKAADPAFRRRMFWQEKQLYLEHTILPVCQFFFKLGAIGIGIWLAYELGWLSPIQAKPAQGTLSINGEAKREFPSFSNEIRQKSQDSQYFEDDLKNVERHKEVEMKREKQDKERRMIGEYITQQQSRNR